MLLALLLCIALPKTSSAQRVSVVLENVSLAEALKKVSAASGYEFFYNSNVVLKSDKRIITGGGQPPAFPCNNCATGIKRGRFFSPAIAVCRIFVIFAG